MNRVIQAVILLAAVVLCSCGTTSAGPESPRTSLLIHGKYVVTGESTADGKLEIISNGALYAENGVITEVGSYDTLAKNHPGATVIGGDRFVVTPGFVNAHHHTSGVTFFQKGAVDKALENWLPQLRSAPAADRYLDELASYLKNLRTGVTSVLQTDNTSDTDNWIRAAKDSGMRIMVGLACGGAYKKEFFEFFDNMWKKHITPDSRVRLFFAPWGVHWAGDDLLKGVAEAAKKYPTGVHIHLSETQYQTGGDKFKESLTEHAFNLGFLGKAVSCGHCVWVNDNDIDLLKKSDASVVTNPSSNLRLLSGVAPVAKMVRKGINVAIGMDGLAFNDDEDIFAEMKLCWYLHKGIGKTPEGITAEDVFRMGTINGARALGLDEITGSIKTGKQADAVLIDLGNIEGVYLSDRHSIVEALLIRGRASDVDTVIVGGEVLLRDMRFVRHDEAEIRRKLRESIKFPEKK